MTQTQLAEKLGLKQASVSGMERRSDIQMSTLKRVIEALGGRLELSAIFPEGSYRIGMGSTGVSDCGDLAAQNGHSGLAEAVGKRCSANLETLLLQEKATARALCGWIEVFEARVPTNAIRVDQPSVSRLLHDAFDESELLSFRNVLSRSIIINHLLSDDDKIFRRYAADFVKTSQFSCLSSKVDTQHTISGLASLARYVRDCAPSLIVTLNAGGRLLGEFVKCHLNLSGTTFLQLDGREVFTPRGRFPKKCDSILVIDSTSRTGFTIKNAIRLISENVQVDRMGSAALAASSEAFERVSSSGVLFYTPNPIAGPVDGLPYDTSKGFRVVDEAGVQDYIFGARAASSSRQLIVSAATITKLMEERSGANC